MRRAALLTVILILAVPACGSDDPDSAVTTTEAHADSSTTIADGGSTTTAGAEDATGPFIEDLEFHDLEVDSGAEVTVTNRDDFAHTFSFDDESVSLSLGGGESDTFTTPAAGEYEIYCEIHGSMSGTLVVS